MTGFLLVLLLFKVYSVVSEWVQSDSLPLFVIPMAFVLFVLFGGGGKEEYTHIISRCVFISIPKRFLFCFRLASMQSISSLCTTPGWGLNEAKPLDWRSLLFLTRFDSLPDSPSVTRVYECRFIALPC